MNTTGAVGKRFVVALVVITICVINSGCAVYHVYGVGGTEGREQGNQPGTEWNRKTLHNFGWGGKRQDLPAENCQLGDGQRLGIEEIKVETNLGYALISVITLGIWIPIDMSWRCAKPPVSSGTL